jgi:parallel beta-helix repeat protein
MTADPPLDRRDLFRAVATVMVAGMGIGSQRLDGLRSDSPASRAMSRRAYGAVVWRDRGSTVASDQRGEIARGEATSVLQRALDIAGDRGVLVAAGDYVLEPGLELPDGASLAGIGPDSRLVLAEGTEGRINVALDARDSERVTVRDLRLSGNRDEQPESSVTYGMSLEGTNSRVSNCLVEGWPGVGIHAKATDGVKLSGNTVSRCREDGIALEGIDDSFVLGNVTRANGYNGVVLKNGTTSTLVAANLVADSDEVGVLLLNGCEHNSVAHNHVDRTGFHGVAVETDAGFEGCERNQIVDNQISNTTYKGVYLRRSDFNQVQFNAIRRTGEGGIVVFESASCQITGNRIQTGSGPASGHSRAIGVDDGGQTASIQVVGNQIVTREGRSDATVVDVTHSGESVVEGNQIVRMPDDPAVQSDGRDVSK